MTTPTKRPFPAMSPEARDAANRKGGALSSSRPFATNPGLAKKASMRAAEVRREKAAARKKALDHRPD